MEDLSNRAAGEVLYDHEDDGVRVRDGADSYLIEDGKIIAQTIRYTIEEKSQ